MKKIFFLFAAAFAVLLTNTSCNLDQTIQELEESMNPTDPEYVISVHQIVRFRRGEQLEREIPDLKQRKLNYRTTPLFQLPEGAGSRLFLILPSQKSMTLRR